MSATSLTVALLTESFFGDGAGERLTERLRSARGQGAELAVLPELGAQAWVCASKQSREQDAEREDGPRVAMQRNAARDAGVALIGASITIDQPTGERRNRAFFVDSMGDVRATYDKVHLPEETGYWETSHYEPGDRMARPVECLGMRVGMQICSDANRPMGSHLLGAMGAEIIVIPRATEGASWDRWRPVMIANALTSCAYVISVNRPGGEAGAEDAAIGGPSVAISPRGEMLVESDEPISLITCERSVVDEARTRYPGYLAIKSSLYAEAWQEAPPRERPHGG
ncbi:MAG: carbon-nitrogen hydrolase family protein [Planctomycetota bacterium]